MSVFRIAIVGRPNVGKSSLTNMLASRKVSIVDPTPGVTRDRVSTQISLEHSDFTRPEMSIELTDTGGYGVYTVEGRKVDEAGFDLSALTRDIEQQISKAVAEADLVLFVIDSQTGVTAQDQEVARLLREGGLVALGDEQARRRRAASGVRAPEVLVVANKVDGQQWEMHALEASMLGLGEPVAVSAKNNFRRREFSDAVYDAINEIKAGRARVAKELADKHLKAGTKPAPIKKEEERPSVPEMKVAIVGKRNAGKSTLVNHLAGQERVIVSEIPGTTRDAIDVRFELDGRSLLAIDTAGLRRKKSFQDRIEWFALDRMQRAIDRSDVALMLIDATVPISHVDHQVGMMLAKSFKPAIIVINKWDVVKDRFLQQGRRARRGEAVTVEAYEEYLRRNLKGLDYAPIAFVSGKEGTNVAETVDLAFDLMNQSRSRASTGKLNRMVREFMTRQGPANKLGTFAKLLFTAQVETQPPTIVCIVNKAELFNRSYERFLINRFREELPFPEVPIKLIIRSRRPMEEIDEAETDEAMEKQAKRLSASEIAARELGGTSAGLPSGGSRTAADFFDEPVAFVDEPSNPKAKGGKAVTLSGYKSAAAGKRGKSASAAALPNFAQGPFGGLDDLHDDEKPEDDLPDDAVAHAELASDDDDVLTADGSLLDIHDEGDGFGDAEHADANDDDDEDAEGAEPAALKVAALAPARGKPAAARSKPAAARGNPAAAAAAADRAKPKRPIGATKSRGSDKARGAPKSRSAGKARPGDRARPAAASGKAAGKASAKRGVASGRAGKPTAKAASPRGATGRAAGPKGKPSGSRPAGPASSSRPARPAPRSTKRSSARSR